MGYTNSSFSISATTESYVTLYPEMPVYGTVQQECVSRVALWRRVCANTLLLLQCVHALQVRHRFVSVRVDTSNAWYLRRMYGTGSYGMTTEVTLSVTTGDADLYISCDDFPTIDNARWSSRTAGGDDIITMYGEGECVRLRAACSSDALHGTR